MGCNITYTLLKDGAFQLLQWQNLGFFAALAENKIALKNNKKKIIFLTQSRLKEWRKTSRMVANDSFAAMRDYRTDTFLKLHRSIVGNKKKHQYRYRNRKYLFFAILTTLQTNIHCQQTLMKGGH